MKKFFSLTLTLAAMLSAMAVSAQAADYSFETDGTPEYYPSSSYEDVYGSRYNYGEKNVVDYQIPKLEYGQLSTTQTGVMEKIMLPGLQGISASGGGICAAQPRLRAPTRDIRRGDRRDRQGRKERMRRYGGHRG